MALPRDTSGLEGVGASKEWLCLPITIVGSVAGAAVGVAVGMVTGVVAGRAAGVVTGVMACVRTSGLCVRFSKETGLHDPTNLPN